MRHVRFECWKSKATDTRPEYVILIAFPRRQLLRYTPLSVLYNLIKHCITYAVERALLNNLTISIAYLLSYRGFVVIHQEEGIGLCEIMAGGQDWSVCLKHSMATPSLWAGQPSV